MLDNCNRLDDLQSISRMKAIRRISIRNCSNLMDLRPLMNCQQIEMQCEHSRKIKEYLGYKELWHRIEPFPFLPDFLPQ